MEHDAGGGGGSPYAPIYTDIYAVPEDLEQFATLIDGDLSALETAWEAAREQVSGQENPNFPGGVANTVSYAQGYPQVQDNASDGIYEGGEFYHGYFLTVGAELALVDDAKRGLRALRDAARLIHNDYLGSDTANSGGMEGAFAAYERSSVLRALGVPVDETNGGTGDERA